MEESKEMVRKKLRYEEVKYLRVGIEDELRDIQRYVEPLKTNFDLNSPQFGSSRNQDTERGVYDDTAVWANQMYANGMTALVIPRANRFSYLKPQGIPSSALSDEELIFLERLSERVEHEYSLPECHFYSVGHEVFSGLGSFGTAVVYERREGKTYSLKSCALADAFFDLSDEDEPDTMFYRKYMRTKSVVQKFPHVVHMDGFNAKDGNTMWEIVYSVEPSQDIRARKGGSIGSERPYITSYFAPNLKEPLMEGGMGFFPFHVARWAKVAGETMGRGCASTCLRKIRVLNKMVKESLKSAELSNAPPITAESDSLILPVSYGARQLWLREAGSPAPEPLNSGSQPQATLEWIQAYQADIKRAFFVDMILREQKKERQSVLELTDERGQMLQQLGPLITRFEEEYLDKVIENTIDFLEAKRDPVFDEIPESLSEATLEIVYTSPAAQAQYSTGIANMASFLQDMAPIMQAKPEIFTDNIDDNEWLNIHGRMRNVPRAVFRSKKDVIKLREGREQAEAQNQQTEQLGQVPGALKDIASARATDPEGIGQLLNI